MHFKTSQGPAKDVYGFCWTIGVKWRDMIGQISLSWVQFAYTTTNTVEYLKPLSDELTAGGSWH